MVRHQKRLGVTDIAWGYDEGLKGYFLTIADERLEWREGQSEEVNKIIEKVSSSQEGNYFDLNTYPVGGFGYKVSQQTMFTFMRRYGINPEKIGKAMTVDEDNPKICAQVGCRALEIEGLSPHKRCARCKSVWYCTRSCQVADWKTHKDNCIEN